MKQKQIALFISIIIGITAGSGILNRYCTGGYKIVVEGKTIGYVEESSQYDEALADVNNTIISDFGEENALYPDAEIKSAIFSKDMLSTEDELKNNIAELSDYMTDGYILTVNNEEICNFKTMEDASDTLDKLIDIYHVDGGKSSFRENVELKESQVSSAGIMPREEAVDFLINSDKIHVKSAIETSYYTTKDYNTIEVEDDTLAKGSRTVISEGEVGEYRVFAAIEYTNGVQIGKSILSEELVSDSKDEIVKVGTKEIPSFGTGEFITPVSGRLSSGFGGRWGRMHKGIDLAAPTGTPINASDTGVVIFSGHKNSFGNLVKIDHQNGYVTYYAHCSELLVSEGEIVTKGQIIAKVGNTGNSTGPHCHFEIRKDDAPQNPYNYIK